ncbi:MAG: TIR domain-containing protein [Planctomycetes bacterium]|nr:TIR domain-containing protein [Planctomycetota bacterium]
MARRVFFSFHYEADIWRAGQVRNSWITKVDREDAGFWDAASWEAVKRQGDEAIKRWINRQLDGTSVTIVLIGSETASRPYVQYEIEKSYEKRNGLVGVFIHNMRDRYQQTAIRGQNPLDAFWVQQDGKKAYLSQMFSTYDYVRDDGYNNIADWVEEAAQRAGR